MWCPPSSKLTSLIDGLLPFCHSWASEQFSRWKTSKQWKGIGKQRLYWLQCNRYHNKCHFSLVLCGLWSKNISSWASDLWMCLYYSPRKSIHVSWMNTMKIGVLWEGKIYLKGRLGLSKEVLYIFAAKGTIKLQLDTLSMITSAKN